MDNEIKRILDFSDDIISVRNNIEDFIMFIEYLDKGGVEALNKWKNASEIIEDAVNKNDEITEYSRSQLKVLYDDFERVEMAITKHNILMSELLDLNAKIKKDLCGNKEN